MRFCSRLTASGDDRFAFSIADGNALTFHFEGVAAEVEAVKSPDLVAAHVFSAIVPPGSRRQRRRKPGRHPRRHFLSDTGLCVR
jgi:hypothetical protein